MPKKASKYLGDMLLSINDIFIHHLKGINNPTGFEQNITVQKAVIKDLEILGECAKRLRQMGISLSQTDQLINRRNTLIHQYDAIGDEGLWRVLHRDLPPLKVEIESLLSQLEE